MNLHAYGNQFQTLMDGASCKHAILKKDACESYAGCYHSKLKAYRMTKRKVQNFEIGVLCVDPQIVLAGSVLALLLRVP